MPSVKPVVVITTLLSTIWTFNDFDNVWLITGGGPLYASSIISTYTYDAAFITNEMAYGLSAAVSVIPILLIFLIFATKSINERNS
jgi:ABC-type sugar transport system permease subunit